MGEAYHVLVSRWPSSKAAADAVPGVVGLLKHILEYRQTDKGEDEVESVGLLSLLGLPPGSLDWALPDIPDPEFEGDSLEDIVTLEEDKISFEGTVSHLADWEPLAVALRTMGAQVVSWSSDEYLEMSEVIASPVLYKFWGSYGWYALLPTTGVVLANTLAQAIQKVQSWAESSIGNDLRKPTVVTVKDDVGQIAIKSCWPEHVGVLDNDGVEGGEDIIMVTRAKTLDILVFDPDNVGETFFQA